MDLASDFTIHDRSDSADLPNVVRRKLDLLTRERHFPLRQICIVIYSHVINARNPPNAILRHHSPWCVIWEAQPCTLFDAYIEAK